MDGKKRNLSPSVEPIKIKKLETTEKEIKKNSRLQAYLFLVLIPNAARTIPAKSRTAVKITHG